MAATPVQRISKGVTAMGGKPNPGTAKDARISGRGTKPGPKPKSGKKSSGKK